MVSWDWVDYKGEGPEWGKEEKAELGEKNSDMLISSKGCNVSHKYTHIVVFGVV